MGAVNTSHQFFGLRWWLWWVALAMGYGLAPDAKAWSREQFLEAIHSVENSRDLERPGRHGELGAYQFRSSTWQMHTAAPFAHALRRPVSDDVAARHFEWISRGLLRNGWEPSVYNIALAWNGGLAGTVRGRAPASAHDYARRVRNLVEASEPPVLVAMK